MLFPELYAERVRVVGPHIQKCGEKYIIIFCFLFKKKVFKLVADFKATFKFVFTGNNSNNMMVI